MQLKAIAAAFAIAALFAVSYNTSAHAESLTNKPAESKKVLIEPGDTLSGIAKENETTYVRLYNANNQIKDPDLIYPEEKVRIPAADEKLPSRPLPESAPPEAVAEATHNQVTRPAPVAKTYSAPAPKPAVKAKQTTASSWAPISGSTAVWDRLASCESGGNWSINTGNGFYGGLQFTLSSWQAAGGSGYPHHASKAEQIARAKVLLARQGWGAWPACTAKLGIR